MEPNVAAPPWSPPRSHATLRARHLGGDGYWLLELSGEADLTTAVLLRDELGQMVAANRDQVVVDLAELAFCDVASAHLIRTARRSVPVTLRGAAGSVKRVFELLDTMQHHRQPGRPRSASLVIWGHRARSLDQQGHKPELDAGTPVAVAMVSAGQ